MLDTGFWMLDNIRNFAIFILTALTDGDQSNRSIADLVRQSQIFWGLIFAGCKAVIAHRWSMIVKMDSYKILIFPVLKTGLQMKNPSATIRITYLSQFRMLQRIDTVG